MKHCVLSGDKQSPQAIAVRTMPRGMRMKRGRIGEEGKSRYLGIAKSFLDGIARSLAIEWYSISYKYRLLRATST